MSSSNSRQGAGEAKARRASEGCSSPSQPIGLAIAHHAWRCGRDAGRRALRLPLELRASASQLQQRGDIALEVEEIQRRRGLRPIARARGSPARCRPTRRSRAACRPAARNTAPRSNRRTRSCWRRKVLAAPALSRPGHSDTRITARSAAIGVGQADGRLRRGTACPAAPDRRRRS